MNRFTKRIAASAVAAALTLPMTANATNGILPLGNGMVAHGFGGAGMANATETMSGVDNPALIARTPKQWGAAASLFSPLRSADFGGGYIDSDNNYFIIPQGGATMSINDKLDWGILLTAMGGMNTDYDATKLGLTGRAGFDLSGLLVYVPFSFKINPKHSIAVAPALGYEMMKADIPAGFMGTGDPDMSGSDSAFGWGVKLGYAGDLGNNVTVGVTYQSRIDMSEMSAFCDGSTAIFGALKQSGKDCSLDMPEQYGVGIAWQMSDKWKLVADVLQVNWSSVDVFGNTDKFTDPNSHVHQKGFGWEDQTIYKIGFGFRSSEKLEWRFGYNYGKSPIGSDQIMYNLLAPAITEQHFTIGLGQTLSGKSQINYYFAYVPENEVDSGVVPPSGTSTMKAKMSQYALGIGYNASF